MKTNKLIALFIGALLPFSACREAEPDRLEAGARYVDVPVSLGRADEAEDGTRSIVDIEVEHFQKAALFAFDAKTGAVLTYTPGSGGQTGEPVVAFPREKSFSWSLPTGVTMDIYAIVNYGDLDLASYARPGLKMAELEEEGGAYVGDKLGYALKGFHAAEYLLFETVEQEGRAVGTGKTHAANLTHAEAVYLLGIVEDLAQQAILLEDCWSGGKINERKEGVITDGEGESMSYGENYGDYLVNAGQPGSMYKTYQEAAEEIIAGCVDIAGEVAELKMGNPYLSNTPDQRDYIESPYSCTSTTDFADNIRSIKNAYEGAQAGDYSISNYVYSQDSELDGKVRKAIEESIAAIEAIQDFENKAKGDTQVKAAMDKVQELEEKH